MSIFEVVFSLTGLVLGLALVEVLAGIAKVLRAREDIKIGLRVPLLGLFVLGDVTSFWGLAYGMRDVMHSVWQSLGTALIICSIYYVAASLVTPPSLTSQADYDAHYWKNKRVVLCLILLCNLITWTIGLAMGWNWSPTIWAINILYTTLILIAAFAKGPRVDIAALIGLNINLIFVFAVP